MAAITIKMGKRGTLVIPAKLRKQFGMEDGSHVNVETDGSGLTIRPAIVYDVEIWTPERKAELLLNNAMTREEWDEIAAIVRADGLDPNNIAGVDPTIRETLLTDAEWDERIKQSKLRHAELELKLSA